MPFLYNAAPIPGHLLTKKIWLPFLYNAAAIWHLQQNKHLTSSFGNVIVQDSCRIQVALYRNRPYSSSYSLLVLVRRASTNETYLNHQLQVAKNNDRSLLTSKSISYCIINSTSVYVDRDRLMENLFNSSLHKV